MKFEYYVLNHDFNSRKIYFYNIFNNYYVQTWTEKEIKKFLRNQKTYFYKSFFNDEIIYGFEALCKQIDSIIACEEHHRCEYEISVGGLFETSLDNYEKYDCYEQAHANIELITREVIYQYKKQLKETEDD